MTAGREPIRRMEEEEPDDGTQTEGMFSDVAADSWYYDAVSYVVSEGLMNGISDDLFRRRRS